MAFLFAGFHTDVYESPSRRLLTNTPITVYLPGTETEATLYTDRTKATVAPNPFVTDALGNGSFFADPGEYDRYYDGSRVPCVVPIDPVEAAQDGDLLGFATQVTVDDEAAARAAADAALADGLDAEAATRAAADVAEAVARAAADTAEATARADSDALLIPLSQKGAANGVGTLDASTKQPVGQVPVLATVSNSSGSYTVPPGVTLLRLTVVGAGGGAGGGGSAALTGGTPTQVGSAGGPAGTWTTSIVTVAPGQTLTIVIGAGGVGGAGGAPSTGGTGNAGSFGTDGGDSSVTGPGVALVGHGGVGGTPGPANSAATGGAIGWGRGNQAQVGRFSPGQGGITTNTSGNVPSAPLGYTASGGSSGGPATATLGGGRGLGGTKATSPAGGAAGASATATGVTGTTSTSPGGGGGGGGGGAPRGAGGAGGGGGPGQVIVEVIG